MGSYFSVPPLTTLATPRYFPPLFLCPFHLDTLNFSYASLPHDPSSLPPLYTLPFLLTLPPKPSTFASVPALTTLLPPSPSLLSLPFPSLPLTLFSSPSLASRPSLPPFHSHLPRAREREPEQVKGRPRSRGRALSLTLRHFAPRPRLSTWPFTPAGNGSGPLVMLCLVGTVLSGGPFGKKCFYLHQAHVLLL